MKIINSCATAVAFFYLSILPVYAAIPSENQTVADAKKELLNKGIITSDEIVSIKVNNMGSVAYTYSDTLTGKYGTNPGNRGIPHDRLESRVEIATKKGRIIGYAVYLRPEGSRADNWKYSYFDIKQQSFQGGDIDEKTLLDMITAAMNNKMLIITMEERKQPGMREKEAASETISWFRREAKNIYGIENLTIETSKLKWKDATHIEIPVTYTLYRRVGNNLNIEEVQQLGKFEKTSSGTWVQYYTPQNLSKKNIGKIKSSKEILDSKPNLQNNSFSEINKRPL